MIDLPWLPPWPFTYLGYFAPYRQKEQEKERSFAAYGMRLPARAPSPAEIRWREEDDWLGKQWHLFEEAK